MKTIDISALASTDPIMGVVSYGSWGWFKDTSTHVGNNVVEGYFEDPSNTFPNAEDVNCFGACHDSGSVFGEDPYENENNNGNSFNPGTDESVGFDPFK